MDPIIKHIFCIIIVKPIFARYRCMKQSITSFAFKISHFIPKNETQNILTPKQSRASDMAEIGTLTWFRDNVKHSEL